ncbi:MAG: NAD-glutamate dehydrogenase, partial [Gammaproteobacteria bacterium]|nr:NAD-glutamate dehydrogenase [Gammaproteobacteria bacterium]
MNLVSNTHVDDVVERMQQRLAEDEVELAGHFARLFWSKTPQEDLQGRNVEHDVGATIDNWRAYRQLPADQLVLSVSNPQHAQDGWQSAYTIVRIIAPDMPFVVDSVLMALSHGGLTTHTLSNVVFSVT